MLLKELTIINKLGLHTRAAAKLVKTASQYESTVEIEYAGKKANAKSITSVMMLAAAEGAVLTVCCHGRDARQVLNAISELIDNYFGEDE